MINNYKLKICDKEFQSINSELIKDSKTCAVSFFSGAGGLDLGVQKAGIKVIASYDNNKDCIDTLRLNKDFSSSKHNLTDINNIDVSSIKEIISKENPEKLIFVGGPPCQPFSKAGYWKTHKNRLGDNDPRNMIGKYLTIIDNFKPDGFILENVESILHPKNKVAAESIIEECRVMGYELSIQKVNSADFGLPQKRKRVFFIASRKPFITELVKTHGNTKERYKNSDLKPYERVIDWIGRFDKNNFIDLITITSLKLNE